MEAAYARFNSVNGTRSVIAGSVYGGVYFFRYHDMKDAIEKSSLVSSTTLLADYVVAVLNIEDQPYVAPLLNGAMYAFVQKLFGSTGMIFDFASVAAVDYAVELSYREIKNKLEHK